MQQKPDWEIEGRDWPNREASRFIQVGDLRWHVQQMGAGPILLLVHGTGSATHSWRDLAPMLAKDVTVIAPDLPGHGFTSSPKDDAGLSLPGMAASLSALLSTLGVTPDLVFGHSAGAAILVRLCLDHCIAPRALISENGALLPLRGLAGHWFAPAARFFATHPLIPRFFAWRAGIAGGVQDLVDSTGSRLGEPGVALYQQLLQSPSHVHGALAMMTAWKLQALEHALPQIRSPVCMHLGANDRTIPPWQAERACALMPQAVKLSFAGLGHLAHEEAPARTSAQILEWIAQAKD